MRRLAILLAIVPWLAACGVPSSAGKPSSHPPHHTTKFGAHRSWVQSVQPNVDSAPAYLPHVKLSKGKYRAIIYVLAGNNTSNCSPSNPVRTAITYALDAATGKVLWKQSTSGPSRCTTAGPVAGPSGQWIYAPGLDGKVHRYDAATGKEGKGHGWPQTVTLMPDVEKVAVQPTIGTEHLYTGTSGFIGDQGHYEGHLVSTNLSSGHSHVFNTLCSNIHQLLGPNAGQSNYCPSVMSGIWGRGVGAIDPVTHDVYIATGNGPWNGKTDWGDSVLKLDPTAAHLIDSYTPSDHLYLYQNDLDLGSSGPAILPTIRQGHHAYHLLVQAGKGPSCPSCGGVALRLLNRDDLSGQGGPGHVGGDVQDIQSPGRCMVLSGPAVWRSPSHHTWVFYASTCAFAGYELSSPKPGTFRLRQKWLIKQSYTTPVIHNGVLFAARDGEVAAYNPTNHKLLWHDNSIAGIHWQYPLVAGHRLFISDESGHVTAYSLHY